VEMVEVARKRGILSRIVSNTTLLSKSKSIALIQAGLDKMVFSMSGASKKTYDSIYKGARYERTLKHMLDFLEINGNMGFPVHTRTVFVEEEKTAKETKKYLECFSKLPLDDVHVSPLINMFGWNKELDISSFKEIPREQWPICKTPWRILAINADGTTRSCLFDYDSRYIIGDANESSILDLWNNERMMRFRQAHIEHTYEDIEDPGLPLCTECSQIWPTSNATDTTQLPNDFLKEVEDFFADKEHAFKAKSVDIETKKSNLAYLERNRASWVKHILSDV